jgi:hypothetical protein
MTKRVSRGLGGMLLLTTISGLSLSSFAQTAATDPTEKPAVVAAPQVRDWSLTFTPYGWLTFMSGSQTVKGRTVPVDTNVFQMFDKSQSLIPFMGYFEARYQDRVGLFVDLMYANLTAADSATKSYNIQPGVGGNIMARASVGYETLTLQFGGAYQVVKAGPDRSAEGPGMAGVGQTAFDVLAGGRYWYQKADITLNLNGALNVNVPDLEVSLDRNKVIARSGVVSWVDPFVGFRVRHKLVPGQDLSLEADIGGFGLGSRISYQALGAYRFNVGTTGSVAWAGVLGYRVLYVDYIRGAGSDLFEMNLLQHGPLLGLSARF